MELVDSQRESPHAVAQRCLDGGTGLQRAQHMKGGDGLACELGSDIRRDDGKAENLYMQRLSGGLYSLEVVPAVAAQAEVKPVSGNRLLHRIGMTVELIADGSADEIGAVGVEALLDQQVDVSKIDITEIDRDRRPWAGVPARRRS